MIFKFQKVQWLFPVVVTLHNLEEAIWLPLLWQRQSWRLPFSANEFRTVALVVTILAYVSTYLSARAGKQSLGAYLLAAFSLVMLLNVFWHVAATLYLRTYAPGVITAVLLVFPVTLYMIRAAVREGYVSIPNVLRRLYL